MMDERCTQIGQWRGALQAVELVRLKTDGLQSDFLDLVSEHAIPQLLDRWSVILRMAADAIDWTDRLVAIEDEIRAVVQELDEVCSR